MNDLKNILKDIAYLGVGAAAVIVETGCKAVKCLVRKGAKIIEENQDTVDEMKQKAKEAGEKIKEAVQDLTKSEEAPAGAEIPGVEITEEEEIPSVEIPVAPDAVYRTDEPAPIEEAGAPADTAEDPKPEETVNG
nr:hypothetical protein [Clostridia bacterium]